MSDQQQQTPEQENDLFLRKYGYAPGNYLRTCIHGSHPMKNVDKRARRCREHAIFLLHQQLLILEIDNAEKAKEIASLKERLDFRVRELIQAASREVIRRREINAHRMVLMTLLLKLRDVLRGYAKNHRDKVHTLEGNKFNRDREVIHTTMKKAKRNDQLADEIDEALLWESPTGAMGTP